MTLRAHRENILRLPQADVAKRADCKQAWISHVECGHMPRPWNRQKLAEAYGVNLDQFETMLEESARENNKRPVRHASRVSRKRARNAAKRCSPRRKVPPGVGQQR